MRRSVVDEGKRFGMNTEISYRVFGGRTAQAIAAMTVELSRLENQLSRFRPDSEVNKINQSAGLGDVKISHEMAEILSLALVLSEISQGMFDITVAPLVDLWDCKKAKNIPAKAKIRKTLSKINYHDLVLKPEDHLAALGQRGQSIDLGGIGKGYASDRCIQVFQQYDVSSAYISIGGNVSTLGKKPDGSLWSVGIQHPRNEDGLIGAVRVAGKAVVTSGDYERCFFDSQYKRWHHILNPTTGYPAESGLISVTVVADRAMIADALSTAIFVAGIDKGLGYLAQFLDSEVIIVDKELSVFISQGLKDCVQVAKGIRARII